MEDLVFLGTATNLLNRSASFLKNEQASAEEEEEEEQEVKCLAAIAMKSITNASAAKSLLQMKCNDVGV